MKHLLSLLTFVWLCLSGYSQGVFYWAPELERHYPLGAFKDHRPTAIMEAFTEARP